MFIGINLPLEVNGVEGQHRRSRVGHRDYVMKTGQRRRNRRKMTDIVPFRLH